ncbi:MAG: GIY-YIG nuclease family protein [Armatimonadota bacterium]
MPPLPVGPGLYRLVLFLPRPAFVQVGRLGAFRLCPGLYAYVGSAKCGIARRVRRHLATEKRLRWHVDYLLAHAVVTEVHALEDAEASECTWAARTIAESGRAVPIPGFGASDCRCRSHLSYWVDTLPRLQDGWTRHPVVFRGYVQPWDAGG